MKLAALLLTVLLTASTCQPPAEDDPGWDCKQHGNHTCGPNSRDT